VKDVNVKEVLTEFWWISLQNTEHVDHKGGVSVIFNS